jgi:DNA-binding LytR/AlgR family response regulator
MRTLIIDDEKPAIELLSLFVEKTPFLQLELATTSVLDALQVINNNSIDLIFLDIEMPDINGIDFLKSISNPPLVIFTTAYDQYAITGYELDIVDYLLKPIRFERFLLGANKAQKILNSKTNNPLSSESSIYIKSNYKTIKINHSDILYIEGLKDYVKIYTTSEMLMTRMNIKGIEKLLPENKFIRIHKSYIVSINRIKSFQKHHVFLDKKEIPIGKTYLQAIQNILN